MRILFIGDVVGAAGMTAVKSMLPDAISRWEVDLAVVNGENSAGAGFGITEDTYQGIRGAGADVVTLGNHSWNRKEALSFIALQIAKELPLLPRFYALGDDRQFKTAAKSDNSASNGCVRSIARHVVNKTAVDLELVQRQSS